MNSTPRRHSSPAPVSRQAGNRLADYWVHILAGLVVTIALWVTYQFVEPAPPDTLTMTTGREDGAYHAFAEALVEEFAAEDIELTLRPSEGSVENLQRLSEDADVSVGFLQSGIANASDYPELLGLASLYVEPLWLFARAELEIDDLPGLAGLDVAIGAPGSGTRKVALELLEANGLREAQLRTHALSGQAAADALRLGEIDAVMTIASPSAPVVRALLDAPEIRLASIDRAEAYARRYPFFTAVSVPEGIIDLARNIPDRNIDLIAAAATLVAHEDLHPALVDLLMRASANVAAEDTLFNDASRFPSPDYLDFPLSDDAERYFKYGVPFLQRYLPFWAANLVDRLKLLALPLLALLLPLTRVLPPAYRWSVRKRVFRWYAEVKRIDNTDGRDSSERRLAIERLDEIEREIRSIDVPLSYAHELYALRLHIDLLRRQLTEQESAVSV